MGDPMLMELPGYKSNIRRTARFFHGIPVQEVREICAGLDELLRDIRVLSTHPGIRRMAPHSVYIAKIAPTSIIFVPCKDGLSHNEKESATLEDLEAGCNVLLYSVLEIMK